MIPKHTCLVILEAKLEHDPARSRQVCTISTFVHPMVLAYQHIGAVVFDKVQPDKPFLGEPFVANWAAKRVMTSVCAIGVSSQVLLL